MMRNGSRTGRATAAGIVLVLVLAGGLGVAAWAVWRSVSPASAPTAEASPGDAPAGPRIAGPARYQAITKAAAEHEREQRFEAGEAVLRGGVDEYAEDQQLRVALAEFLVRRGRLAEAYEQYVAALAIGPRDPAIEFKAGMMASVTGQTERAGEHFAAAQRGDPNEPAYPLYLASVQLKLGQLNDARANLVRATVLDESNATAWGTLAELELRTNEPTLAAQHARKARGLDASEPAWRLLEARALKRMGEPGQALILLGTLDEGVRDRIEYLRTIGECLAMLDRREDAADRYGAAADRHPDDAVLAYEAAVWAERVGRIDEARRLAARSAALGHGPARELAARLGAGG